MLGGAVREVGRGRACGALWPLVRRQEGRGRGQELCDLSLGLVLWALLSPLHLAWGLPAALAPAGLGALLNSLHETQRGRCLEVCVPFS